MCHLAEQREGRARKSVKEEILHASKPSKKGRVRKDTLFVWQRRISVTLHKTMAEGNSGLLMSARGRE